MTSIRGHRTRDSRLARSAFFLLAVSLHIALLYLPISRFELITPPDSLPLEIFLAPVSRDTQAPIPKEHLVEVPADAQPALAAMSAQPEPATAYTPLEPVTTHSTHKPVEPVVTTTLLLHQASELKLPGVKTPPLTLGVPSHKLLPANLSQLVLPLVETMFAALYSPSQQEVIDQWQDPDGTIRAVIRLPNGITVCGSRERWDPINPLFEPVAMYHKCAGGGRRGP